MDREMLEIVRELGGLKSRVDGLEKRLDESLKQIEKSVGDVENSVSQVDEKMDTIIKTLSQVQGGWKALAILGGFLGAVIAAVTAILGISR